MRLKRKAIAEYPFHGTFYTVITNKPEDGNLLGDGDLLGNEKTDSSPEVPTTGETILLETECDIQQAAKLINSGTIMADYKVFSRAKLVRSYLYVSIPILNARIMQYQSKAGL